MRITFFLLAKNATNIILTAPVIIFSLISYYFPSYYFCLKLEIKEASQSLI